MRIVRLADLPAVMYIRRYDDVLVALPARLPQHKVLAMASLVLSGDEFAELAGSITNWPAAKDVPGSTRSYRG